jgi:hypothetical protein
VSCGSARRHPDGQIDTEIVHLDFEKDRVVFKAVVTVPSTGARATGYCEGDRNSFKMGYIEKAETQAIGRALALLGYGTAQAAELDIDDGDKLSDSPISKAETNRIKDSIENRKKVAAEIILKLGYRPNFEQWQGLAREQGIAPVPSGPDTMDTAFLTRLLDALTNNAA